jgi:hypothetical protein
VRMWEARRTSTPNSTVIPGETSIARAIGLGVISDVGRCNYLWGSYQIVSTDEALIFLSRLMTEH